MISRVCEACGNTYQAFPSKCPRYCSSKCAGAAKVVARLTTACAQCKKEFQHYPSKPNTRFCSKSCRTTASNLTSANPSFHRDVTGANNPMYGKGMKGASNPMYGRRGAASPRWTGGRRSRKDGYQLITVPDDYPNPAETHVTGSKYALEHRVVMERHLGRYLTTDEVVHHIDRDPSNNALSNLQLFASQAEHIRIGHKSRSAAEPSAGVEGELEPSSLSP